MSENTIINLRKFKKIFSKNYDIEVSSDSLIFKNKIKEVIIPLNDIKTIFITRRIEPLYAYYGCDVAGVSYYYHIVDDEGMKYGNVVSKHIIINYIKDNVEKSIIIDTKDYINKKLLEEILLDLIINNNIPIYTLSTDEIYNKEIKNINEYFKEESVLF